VPDALEMKCGLRSMQVAKSEMIIIGEDFPSQRPPQSFLFDALDGSSIGS